MNEAQMERLAKRVAKETVREAFVGFTLDPADRVEIIKDMMYLRKRRVSYEKVTSIPMGTAVTVMATILVTGIWGTLWDFLKNLWTQALR